MSKRSPSTKRILEFLERGYSLYEIGREMRSYEGKIRDALDDLPEVIFFDEWKTSVRHYGFTWDGSDRQVSWSSIRREVLVMLANGGFVVRYYSMTSGGSHMRLESTHSFEKKSGALAKARKLKEEHS